MPTPVPPTPDPRRDLVGAISSARSRRRDLVGAISSAFDYRTRPLSICRRGTLAAYRRLCASGAEPECLPLRQRRMFVSTRP
jgi:hypothetical protein